MLNVCVPAISIRAVAISLRILSRVSHQVGSELTDQENLQNLVDRHELLCRRNLVDRVGLSYRLVMTRSLEENESIVYVVEMST